MCSLSRKSKERKKGKKARKKLDLSVHVELRFASFCACLYVFGKRGILGILGFGSFRSGIKALRLCVPNSGSYGE